jgi:uncharacterized membrane protein YjjP (DUF1212 family)
MQQSRKYNDYHCHEWNWYGASWYTAVGRKFTELQGWMNQYIAATADTVVLMVSGIPVTIKDKK